MAPPRRRQTFSKIIVLYLDLTLSVVNQRSLQWVLLIYTWGGRFKAWTQWIPSHLYVAEIRNLASMRGKSDVIWIWSVQTRLKKVRCNEELNPRNYNPHKLWRGSVVWALAPGALRACMYSQQSSGLSRSLRNSSKRSLSLIILRSSYRISHQQVPLLRATSLRGTSHRCLIAQLPA